MNDFAGELARELQRYANVVEEELLTAQEDVADIAVDKLRQNSPKTGGYRKGWRKKKVDKAVVIHNTKGQLTHLLENGHAKADGGRVPEKVHIRPLKSM